MALSTAYHGLKPQCTLLYSLELQVVPPARCLDVIQYPPQDVHVSCRIMHSALCIVTF